MISTSQYTPGFELFYPPGSGSSDSSPGKSSTCFASPKLRSCIINFSLLPLPMAVTTLLGHALPKAFHLRSLGSTGSLTRLFCFSVGGTGVPPTSNKSMRGLF